MKLLSKTDSKDCSMCNHSWENHGNGQSPCFWESLEHDDNGMYKNDFCNCEWFTIKMTFNKNK